MSLDEIERLARLFHDTYERLAAQYGYVTRFDTRDFDAGSPNGRLMLAVCSEVFGPKLSLLDEAREAGLKLWNTAAWPSAEAGRVSVDMYAWDEWAESLRRLEK
jgi:hypothetical protein